MMGYGNYGYGFERMGFLPAFGFGFVLLMLWTLVWKGLALWHSSKRNQPWWFAILLIINTAGILEIIYLFGVAKLKFDQLFKVK